jgi:hypothetical protein
MQFHTFKLDPSWNLLWESYDVPSNGTASSLAFDKVSGSVYVAGFGGLVKYNSLGVKQWENDFGPRAWTWTSPYHFGMNVALGREGNLYVVNENYNDSTTLFNAWTGQYDPGGGLHWVMEYSDGAENEWIGGAAAWADGTLCVAVSGSTRFFGPCLIPTPTPLSALVAGTSLLYPSPATGDYATVAYMMAAAGTAQVLVWNAIGESAAETSERKAAGAQSSRLTVRDYADGVYFYQVVLRYDGGSTEKLPVEKFIVIH